MSVQSHPARYELTLEKLGHENLQNLTDFYLSCHPEKNQQDFIEEYLDPMEALDFANDDSFLEQLEDILKNDKSAKIPYDPIVLSCAFYFQTKKNLAKENRELAWSHMAQARYWCGVAISGGPVSRIANGSTWEDSNIEMINLDVSHFSGITLEMITLEKSTLEKSTSLTQKEMASHGGTVRAEKKYGKIKNEAFRLAIENSPSKTGWKSKLHAATTITPKVRAFAKLNGESLSETYGYLTITRWLTEMPEAVSLFPTRETVKKKRKTLS